MSSYLRRSTAACALVASALAPAFLPTAALAAEADPAAAPQSAQTGNDEDRLNDIVVTATRRDSNLQSTPIAVSAVDSRLIRQASPRDRGDLAAFVPNFSANTITNFNAASFAMRGVGQTSIIVYFEPPVAVLVDDFVVPSVQTQLLDVFDVSQVEVLRGPQGTLFGKNTTGGAVTVRTKRPELGTIGGRCPGRGGQLRHEALPDRAERADRRHPGAAFCRRSGEVGRVLPERCVLRPRHRLRRQHVRRPVGLP